MAKDRLEDFVPVVKYYGVKTDKNATLTGTLTVTGAITANGGITATSLGSTGALTVTSASANALAVGATGATNPVLKVDASTASVATGLSITGAAAGSRLALAVISSGTNEGLNIDAKGSGSITVGNTSTGNINLIRAVSASSTVSAVGVLVATSGTAATAGGAEAVRIGSGASGVTGIYTGSGAPSATAPKGSLYLRTDGSSTSTRAYINTDAGTTWTALTTAA
jgi:hypothetical protein